jgi:hypothetical protein
MSLVEYWKRLAPASASPAGPPGARTSSVEELVAMTLDGRVRIPVVQHGLAWEDRDVRDLFDSIYRGFPIGSLFLQQASAEAAEVRVGPIPVMGTERPDALWVVDGQQRLTSLAVALGRPAPVPTTPDDPFVIYFDAATEKFEIPSRIGAIASTWVPLPQLLDASHLTKWVSSWQHHGDAALRARIFEAGKRLREYRVPLYVIKTTDEEILRTIFERVNNDGKPLSWNELRDGLFGRGSKLPSSTPELADELIKLGMGRPDEDELSSCLVAYKGLDVTRSFDEHLRNDPARLDGAAAEALPVLRRALGFLRSDCKIPHLRLLPYPALLAALTRFFKEHPEPNDRTQTLLVRWIWRALVVTEHDDRAFRRSGIAAITADEEASMQALLQLVPAARLELELPAAFDPQSARSRLVLLGMASLAPRELERGQPIDVAVLVRTRDVDAFCPLFPPGSGETRGPANRVLLPNNGPAADSLRAFIERHGVDDPVLRSHAIDPAIAAAIRDGDSECALARRAQLLASTVNSLVGRMAAWGRSDRPSLEYLMKQASA